MPDNRIEQQKIKAACRLAENINTSISGEKGKVKSLIKFYENGSKNSKQIPTEPLKEKNLL